MRALAVRLPSCALILVAFLTLSVDGQDAGSLCRSAEGTKSCGQCIKQHPDCAWCTDPAFSEPARCDVKRSLTGVCSSSHIYQPKSNISKIQNQPIGTVKPDGFTVIQLQPQQVKVTMKPGETVSFVMEYMHRGEPLDAQVLNSEASSQGLDLAFTADCKGQVREGRTCQRMEDQDRAKFTVNMTLKECKTAGDAVLSVGISGLRDVSAVYISPLCGCECEKFSQQEQKSGQCYGFGTLVCGACVCDEGRGGTRCECDLAHIGAVNAQELEGQCSQGPDDDLCSGKGTCSCGRCICDTEYISGQFCECDDLSCPLANGMMCGGHGNCRCGACACEDSWTGRACDCSTDNSFCEASDGSVCGGHGSCSCAECNCDEDWEGDTCEERIGGEMEETPAPPEPETEAPPPEPEPEPEPETETEEPPPEEPEEKEPEAEPETSQSTAFLSNLSVLLVLTIPALLLR